MLEHWLMAVDRDNAGTWRAGCFLSLATLCIISDCSLAISGTRSRGPLARGRATRTHASPLLFLISSLPVLRITSGRCK